MTFVFLVLVVDRLHLLLLAFVQISPGHSFLLFLSVRMTFLFLSIFLDRRVSYKMSIQIPHRIARYRHVRQRAPRNTPIGIGVLGY
jgi:hypothetical protein